MAEHPALISDLSNLVARHPNVTGPEFIAACERVADAYFDDIPIFDADEFLRLCRARLEADD